MADPTGFITNKAPYSNADLNTVFAPIQQFDKGTLGTTYQNTSPYTLISENVWCWFPYIYQQKNSGNISVVNEGGTTPAGLKINSNGVYKLNLILFFGPGLNNEEGALVNIFLQNSKTIPAAGIYSSSTMIPSPNMTKIYSMSICGASSFGSGTSAIGNGNNNYSNANLLGVNAEDATTSNITTRPYFFRFIITNSASSGGNIKSNIQTIEILFEGIKDQLIYPFINVTGGGSANPSTTLDAINSKWMITKLEPIVNSIAELNLQNYTQLYNNPCDNIGTLSFNKNITVSNDSPPGYINTFKAYASNTVNYGTIAIDSTFNLLNKTILVDIFTTSILMSPSEGVCNFFFGNNNSGGGFMFRFDGRSGFQSGIATTTDWTNWSSPSGSGINLSSNVWYTFVISIDSYGNISWAAQQSGTSNFVNNTIYSSSDTGVTTKVSSSNTWLAVNGDEYLNSYSYFDNIIIYNSATL